MPNKVISEEYTRSIAKNLDEKILPWTTFIESKLDEELDILDIGSAGGEFVEELMKIVSSKHAIWAIDFSREYVDRTSRLIGNRSLLGNACELPFESDTFDAINCSSLMHEVFTYGHDGQVGFEALRKAFEEIARVLKPGGLLFYRDVLAPGERDYFVRSYSWNSLKFFINLFLPIFVDSKPLIYKDNYFLKKEGAAYKIFASAFLHREIQKHYLLCLGNISSVILSASMEKDIVFPSKKEQLLHLEKRLSEGIESNPVLFTKAIEDWLAREGIEKYTYATVNELIELCKNISPNSEYSLLPMSDSNHYRQLRNQDNLFLKEIISDPEEEGKQVILFKKSVRY